MSLEGPRVQREPCRNERSRDTLSDIPSGFAVEQTVRRLGARPEARREALVRRASAGGTQTLGLEV